MDRREYNKRWMREFRALKTNTSMAAEIRKADLLRQDGRCIHCEMIISESPGHDCQRPWGFLKVD